MVPLTDARLVVGGEYVNVDTVLITACSILLTAVGWFLKGFAKDVRALREEVVQMHIHFHSRLSVLESKNGIYNAATSQFHLSQEDG